MIDPNLPDVDYVDHIDLPTAILYKVRNDLIWIRYKDFPDEIGIEHAHENSAALAKLTGGNRVHLLIDFRGAPASFSNEAREFFAKNNEHSQNRKSQALVIEGLAHKLVANFYMNFNRPDCPVGVFYDPRKALEWIETLD